MIRAYDFAALTAALTAIAAQSPGDAFLPARPPVTRWGS